jgi:hypothetical protein
MASYSIEDIDKILGFKSWSDKKKLDTLLHMDCFMYCNLGTDSTQKEKDEVRKNSRKIYTAIKKIYPQLGSDFLRLMDTK